LGVYQAEKRMGKTNKGFEEWMMDHLYPVRGEDGSIIYLKDMALRNIILSSIGIKPSLRDLLMPADSFAKKYITEDFNPSMNIYFSATVSSRNKKGFDDHLVMEGFAFRLIGKKGKMMIDIPRSWDLLMNKFSYRSIDDPSVYKDRTTWRLLQNYSSLFSQLGWSLREKAVPSAIFMNPQAYKTSLNEREKQLLKKSAISFEKGLIFSKEARILARLLTELRGIYYLLGEPEKLTLIIDKHLEKIDNPLFQLFKGQSLLDLLQLGKSTIEGERSALASYSEEAFNKFIKSSKTGTGAGYLGLLNLYAVIPDSAKMDSLTFELIKEPDIYRSIFSYNIRYDTSMAIYLLKHWTEVNPYDKKADSLLIYLRNSYH
ncbi:MAG: hypothetical protein U9N06_07045, partial [candidate division WOR-3 bacterium]|nr:hypothetical protein [candidate division WOR-3 bacterium]